MKSASWFGALSMPRGKTSFEASTVDLSMKSMKSS